VPSPTFLIAKTTCYLTIDRVAQAQSSGAIPQGSASQRAQRHEVIAQFSNCQNIRYLTIDRVAQAQSSSAIANFYFRSTHGDAFPTTSTIKI